MEQLSFEITAELKKLIKGLNRASAKIESFSKRNEKRLKQFGANAKRIGQNMSVGLTLPLVALGTASVKAASDFEETESKFQTIFSNIRDEADKTAKSLRDSYGLSNKESLELLGNTGDLLTGFGFTQKAALDLSNDVNKLAVDLASFTNFSGGAKGASEALTKALLGERESVKSLGISILEADVKAKVLENTQKGLTFESERQAKAFATLQIAQEQSKNAIGDYARTSGSFANQMRLLQARAADLGQEFGKILLPIAQKLVKATQGLIKRFSNLDDSTKKIIVVVAGLVAAMGPLLIVIGGIASALPAIISGLAILTGPIGLIIAAVGALTAIIIANWDTIKAWATDIANYFIDLYNESIIFRTGIEAIIFYLKTFFNVAKFVFNALVTIVKTNFKIIRDILIGAGDLLKDVLTFNFGNIENSIKKFKDSFVNNIGTGIAQIANDAKKLWDETANNFKDSVNNALNRDNIKPIDLSASDESKEKLKDDVTESVKKGVQEGLEPIGNLQSQGAIGLQPFEMPETLGVRDFFNSITEVSKQTDEALNKLFSQLQRVAAKTDETLPEVFARFAEFGQGLNNLITNSISGTLSNLGTAIGEAIGQGTSISQAIGESLLQSMGQFLSQLGDMLIQYGLFGKAKGALDTAIAVGGQAAILSGAAAVGVGIALKAISGAIGSRTQSGFSGGGTGASVGGGGVNNNFSQSFAADREIILKVRGRDLVAVLNNQNNFNNVLG